MKKSLCIMLIIATAILFAAPVGAESFDAITALSLYMGQQYDKDGWAEGAMLSYADGATWETLSEREKLQYLMGLITGLSWTIWASDESFDDSWRFPYRLGTYVLELDVFYRRPDNKEVLIPAALVTVNEQLKQR